MPETRPYPVSKVTFHVQYTLQRSSRFAFQLPANPVVIFPLYFCGSNFHPGEQYLVDAVGGQLAVPDQLVGVSGVPKISNGWQISCNTLPLKEEELLKQLSTRNVK